PYNVGGICSRVVCVRRSFAGRFVNRPYGGNVKSATAVEMVRGVRCTLSVKNIHVLDTSPKGRGI
ncbi:MAG: hypothetical protein IKW68_05435, partial [Clostridia bacterium]|nr:hypothetical protein [Clostridia bacterium]